MKDFYQGELAVNNIQSAIDELKEIKEKLKGFSPDQVIWDIEDLSKQPPWGNNISSDITDLSNYFITSDGRDFIETFELALQKALEVNEPVKIKSM